MRRRDQERVSRLRAEEIRADEIARPQGEAVEYRQLRELRQLDERLGERSQLLDDLDRAIIDKALSPMGLNYSRIGVAVGRHRSTVWRRVGRLLEQHGYLKTFAETMLGESQTPASTEWPVLEKMMTTLGWYMSDAAGSKPAEVLSIDDYNRLCRMFRGGTDARRSLRPDGLKVERQRGKITITGPGPLPPVLKRAVQSGKAERIYPGQPRCHACGRFIAQAATGRRPKYCNERCRSRYRRRSL